VAGGQGAPETIARLSTNPPAGLAARVNALAERGYRILVVAAGPDDHLQFVGLIGLLVPPIWIISSASS